MNSQIFNLDKSGFPLNPKPPRVIAKKGDKHPSSIASADKSQITVLCCCNCNAGGYPPVIFDRKTLNLDLTNGEIPGTMYGLSNSGWIDSEIFKSWFMHLLLNHYCFYGWPFQPLFSTVCKQGRRASHCVLFTTTYGSTHKSQPLVKGVFGPLKKAWKEEKL